jgi:hypothetical protein
MTPTRPTQTSRRSEEVSESTFARVPRSGHGIPLRIASDDVLLAIALGATAVTLWPIIVAVKGPQPLQLAPLVAHVAGMLAGFGVLVLLALMARIPALERGVGSDVLARWHARGGRLVMTLILVHAVAAVIGWAQSRHESSLLALWHVLALP